MDLPYIEIILGGITLVLNFYLGLIVYWRNNKSWTHRLFLILTFFLNAYIVINYLSLHPPLNTPDDQLFWIRMVMAICSFIGPTLILLIHTFPGVEVTLKKWKLAVLAALCSASFFLSVGPFVFTDLKFINGKPVPTPGPGIPVFFLDFIGLFILSFILMLWKWRKSVGLAKQQAFYFLLGIIGTFTLMGLTTVVFVAILKISDLVFLGPIFPVILVGAVAYSIIKHRFLDIRVVVARTVTFTLLVGILGFVLSGGLYVLGGFVLGRQFQPVDFALTNGLALLSVLLFQPLRKFLQKATDKIFFKDAYSSRQLLYDVALALSRSLRLEDLAEQFLQILVVQMRITKACIVLKRKNESFGIFASSGQSWEVSDDDCKLLLQYSKMTVLDEVEDQQSKEVLKRNDVFIVAPLQTANEHIGFLLFSDKSSGDLYSEEDLHVINTLVPEAAVAIENALSYDEISRFNITLQEEVKKATADLQIANEKLKELDKKKDEFVSLASHELRTPMTSIKSYLWMALTGRGGPLNDKQKYYLDRSYNSTIRLIKLVNDMLNISRIESSRVVLDIVEIELKKLLDETLNEVKPRADEVGINIVPDYDSCGATRVLVDVDKIKEVLINLLGNAVKFTPAGGQITLLTHQNGNEVIISVTDTGEGLEKEDIKKLFQKFGFLAGSYVTNQNASQGTGLGLYISKSIVELHKGKIWVESQGKGKGSTFSFTLRVSNQKDLQAFKEQYGGKEGLGIIRTTI